METLINQAIIDLNNLLDNKDSNDEEVLAAAKRAFELHSARPLIHCTEQEILRFKVLSELIDKATDRIIGKYNGS